MGKQGFFDGSENARLQVFLVNASGDLIAENREYEGVDVHVLPFLLDQSHDTVEKCDRTLLRDVGVVLVQPIDGLRVDNLTDVPVGCNSDGDGLTLSMSAKLRSDGEGGNGLDLLRRVELTFE